MSGSSSDSRNKALFARNLWAIFALLMVSSNVILVSVFGYGLLNKNQHMTPQHSSSAYWFNARGDASDSYFEFIAKGDAMLAGNWTPKNGGTVQTSLLKRAHARAFSKIRTWTFNEYETAQSQNLTRHFMYNGTVHDREKGVTYVMGTEEVKIGKELVAFNEVTFSFLYLTVGNVPLIADFSKTTVEIK